MGKTKEIYEDLKLRFDSLVEDHEALLAEYRLLKAENEQLVINRHAEAMQIMVTTIDKMTVYEDRAEQAEQKLEIARKSAQYWKSEHLAGNSEIDAIEDRADRLAVIADALAVEGFGNPFWKGIFGCWRATALQQQKRIDRAEAKLRELVEATQRLLNKVNRVTSNHRHGTPISNKDLDSLSNEQINAESAYQAAFKAASEGGG